MSRLTVKIEDMCIDMFLGIHDFEQERPQRVLICVDMHFDDPGVIEGGFFDYDKVVEFLRGYAGQRIGTQEELVAQIREFVVALGCEDVRIYSRKPDIFADCASVGVVLQN